MGFKLAGVDPAKIMVAGNPASKVMLGTGSSAVQVWSNAPAYPASGTWGGGAVPSGITTQASHTITENGNYTIAWSVNYTTVPSGSLPGARINSNGATLCSGGYRISPGESSANLFNQAFNLVAGDVITFCTDTETAGAIASGGTWTITKN